MKKSMILTVVAVVAAAVALADQKPAARRRPPRNPNARPSGGIVEKAMTSKVFRILDTTATVPAAKLSEMTRAIRYAVLLPIEVVNGEKPAASPFESAEKLVAQENVGAGALIVDDARLPMILVAPDRKWAIMNVSQIKADSPSPEKLLERFNKLYWGAIARALGAGISSYPGCVLTPYTTVAELDAVKATRPCPEPFNKMLVTGNAYGIKTLTIASYRMACEKGWAPAPKTEEQKIIWEEVKAGKNTKPTNPLRITKEKQ